MTDFTIHDSLWFGFGSNASYLFVIVSLFNLSEGGNKGNWFPINLRISLDVLIETDGLDWRADKERF